MMEIYDDIMQGSPEWFQARAGIPTASMYKDVMANGKDGGASKTRKTYMLKLLGERLTEEPTEGYTNHHMERGKEMEAEARAAYEFREGVTAQQIGFIRNGDTGCSPDSIICAEGLLEIKTKLPHLQLEVLLANKLPAEHVKQVQGQLWVSEREWCDFVSYWPRLPLFVFRVYRDEEMIKAIKQAVDKFNDELNELENKVRGDYL